MDEALELQFNPRRSVNDVDSYVNRGRQRSEAARARHHHLPDLRYGKGPLASLDYFPCGAPARPLVVYLHGGYWRGRDKLDYSFVADGLLPAGCNVAVMNYDLCPAVTVAQIVQQVRDGLVWLDAQASSLGFARGILAVGNSAGAHLIAATLARTGRAEELPEGIIRKAYLISGIYDLTPVLHITVNQEIRLVPDDVPLLSPIRYPLAESTAYEVLAGTAEPAGWVRQSQDLVAHIVDQGLAVGYHPRPGLNHYSIVEELATPDGFIARLVGRGAQP